jgi:drug/metabolite transporter (DMT)-like permease
MHSPKSDVSAICICVKRHHHSTRAVLLQLFFLVALTMIAFAANSVFTRLGLIDEGMEAAEFTFVRLISGAVVLALLVLSRTGVVSAIKEHGNVVSAAMLFAYAAGFSFAYLHLDTGTGALILFACVQATMIGWSIATGHKPVALEWAGLMVAFAAFVWLVSPGLSAPDPFSAFLMIIAGMAWGIYSLRGRGLGDPLAATAGNFILSAPLAILLLVVFSSWSFSTFGVIMAVASGAITSALGYALWYWCLPQLNATRAAIVQLTVPAIATLGGIAFSGEELTWRLGLSCALILGGVAIAILAKQKTA